MDPFLSNLWRRAAGLPEKTIGMIGSPKQNYPREADRFLQLMRNRLTLAYYRYGGWDMERLGGYDLLGEIHRRLEAFLKDHNLEHLVDMANYALLAFFVQESRGDTMRPVDDGEHCKEVIT